MTPGYQGSWQVQAWAEEMNRALEERERFEHVKRVYDCTCAKPKRSGRFYEGRESCRGCDKLLR